jgi:hypothetical protein
VTDEGAGRAKGAAGHPLILGGSEREAGGTLRQHSGKFAHIDQNPPKRLNNKCICINDSKNFVTKIKASHQNSM